MLSRGSLPAVLLALALGCGGRAQAVADTGGEDGSSSVEAGGAFGMESSFRGDGGTDASDDVLVRSDAPDADDAGEAGSGGAGVPCGYDLFDGGPVFCSPPQYCQVSCTVSALCVGYGSDASTCPADTVTACSPGDGNCPFQWYSGGAPNDGCCENAVPFYSCVDAQPPQTSGDGQPVGGPCILYSAPNTYVCACMPF